MTSRLSGTQYEGYQCELELDTGEAVRFRLKQETDGTGAPPFEERIGREFYQSYGIIASGFDGIQSRQDQRTFYQDSWAGGSLWERPRYSGEFRDFYHRGRGLDSAHRPGDLYPSNRTNRHYRTATFQTGTGNLARFALPNHPGGNVYVAALQKTLYALSGRANPQPSQSDVSPGYEVYRLRDSDDNWQKVSSGASPDLSSEDCYGVLTGTRGSSAGTIGHEIFWLYRNRVYGWNTLSNRFTTYPSATDRLPEPAGFGSNLLQTVDGKFLYYSGNRFFEFDDTRFDDDATLGDFSVARYNTAFDDDGLGADFLSTIENDKLCSPAAARLAISTPQGVYYVKNVLVGSGLPMAHIFRLNRTSEGFFVREPVALLPAGDVATSIHWHGGSLLMMGTGDYEELLSGNTDKMRFSMWQVQPNAVVSRIGTIDGGSDPIFDTDRSRDKSRVVPYLLGSDGSNVYVGGKNSVWRFEYDQTSIEELFYSDEWEDDVGIHQYAKVLADDETPAHLFVGSRGQMGVVLSDQFRIDLDYLGMGNVQAEDPDEPIQYTGSAVTPQIHDHYVISLPFDFEIPHEEKQLTRVEIVTEEITRWREAYVAVAVRVDADEETGDDVGWHHVGVHLRGTRSVFDIPLSDTFVGDQFQIRLSYVPLQGESPNPKDPRNRRVAIRSVMAKATTGVLVRRFGLVADTEFRNLQGDIIDPEDVYYMWQSIAGSARPVTFRHWLADRFENEPKEYERTRIDQVQVRRSDGQMIDRVELLLTVLGEVSFTGEEG